MTGPCSGLCSDNITMFSGTDGVGQKMIIPLCCTQPCRIVACVAVECIAWCMECCCLHTFAFSES